MKIIDIHTHGIGGYDTRTKSADDILKIAQIHGSFEVSEILLTIYPSSIKVMRENMEAVRKAMELQDARHKIQDTRQSPSPPLSPPLAKGGMRGGTEPANILGLHLEGPFLNPAKCGALNKVSFTEPTDYNFEELIEGFEDLVKIITIAPEIKGALRLIKKMTDRGIVVSMGHSDATYTEAEAGFHAGAKGITHIFNAMRGFHHREPGIAGFGLLNQDIYIEVIADPYHLHGKTLELIFETKKPKRVIIISDTVKETKKRTGFNRGITDTHGKLLGGSMSITESSKRLVKMGYDEGMVMACITKNPQKYLS